MTVADDRDALIATLTEEGWERHRIQGITCRGWWLVESEGYVEMIGPGVDGSGVVGPAAFTPDIPNSVILAAARAAVETEQSPR